MNHVPIWLPPLPFAVIALTLLGLGIWAWFQGEEQ
jgi:hypothetical protein